MHKYNLADFIWQVTGRALPETELASVIFNDHCMRPGNGKYLAGGALRRTVIGQPLESDFDYFFTHNPAESVLTTGDNELLPTIALFDASGHKRVRENEHNITYEVDGRKVQLIKKLWESPEKVIDDFDYTNCQLITDGVSIWVGEYTMWDLARMKLRIHRIHNVQASLRRLIKYTKQGFYACDGTLLGILHAAKEATLQEAFYIDLENPKGFPEILDSECPSGYNICTVEGLYANW